MECSQGFGHWAWLIENSKESFGKTGMLELANYSCSGITMEKPAELKCIQLLLIHPFI